MTTKRALASFHFSVYNTNNNWRIKSSLAYGVLSSARIIIPWHTVIKTKNAITENTETVFLPPWSVCVKARPPFSRQACFPWCSAGFMRLITSTLHRWVFLCGLLLCEWVHTSTEKNDQKGWVIKLSGRFRCWSSLSLEMTLLSYCKE